MINEYLFYLKIEKNFSEYTIEAYQNVIKVFEEFLVINKLEIKEVRAEDFKLYIRELYSLRYSKTTISQHISVLKSLYKFLNKKYDIKNESDILVYPKLDVKLPEFLFFSEMEELLLELENGELRTYLIFLFIYATGVRVSELTELMLYDIYDGNVRIVGKGNKERLVPISAQVVTLIDIYVSHRKEKSPYLFVNNRGNKLTSRGVRYLMNRELDKAAIQQKITPHILRHTFATHLLSNGMDIKLVQEMLGHSSLHTTQVYTHVSKSELIDAYNKASKRNENE